MTVEMIIAMLKGMDENSDLSPEELKAKAQGILDAQKKVNDAAIAAAVGEETKKLEAAEGKAAGILEDKKKAQEKAAVAEAELEEFKKSKMNDKDRREQEFLDLQKSVKAANDALKAANDALIASDAKNKELQTGIDSAARTHKLDLIASGFTFSDSLPKGAGRKHFVESAFKDIDLNDDTAVEATTILFRETHKGVLVAKAPDGTGRKPGLVVSPTTTGGDGDKTERDKEIENMSAKERQAELRKMG